jgi:hypothetical protein
MAKEKEDKPVLGDQTGSTYSKYCLNAIRFTCEGYILRSKDLDDEIKRDPAYRSKPLLRLDKRDQVNNLAEPAPATLKCGQCGHQYPYGQPWCERCGGKALSDAELIQQGKLDDVVRAHVAWVRAEAKKRWDKLNPPRKLASSKNVPAQHWRSAIDLNPPRPEETVTFEDFVAEGLRALAEATKGYKRRGNGLNAYAREFVRGALADAATDWRNKSGLQMDSRLQRFIRSHPFWRPEWIQEKFPQYTIARIEHEQELAYAVWVPETYVDDFGDRDEINDAYKEFEHPAQATLPVFHAHKWRGCEWGPISEGSRNAAKGYRWSLVSPELRRLKNKLNLTTAALIEMPVHKLAMMVRALPEGRLRNLKRLANKQELRNIHTWAGGVRASLWNDRVEADYRKRDLERLRRMGRNRAGAHEHDLTRLEQIGRNDYANWLVNRKTTCVEPSNTPAPFVSKATEYCRGTHLVAAKLLSNPPEVKHLGPPLPGQEQAEKHSLWNTLPEQRIGKGGEQRCLYPVAWTLNAEKMFEEATQESFDKSKQWDDDLSPPQTTIRKEEAK